MPTFACPYCGKSFQANASAERHQVNCPQCAQPFEITDPKASGLPPAPQAAAWTPPPVPPQNPYSGPSSTGNPFVNDGARKTGFECPYCHSHEGVRTENRVSLAGWAVLIAMLFVCFPFFWIGFMIKEDVQFCRSCGIKIGSG